MVWKFITTQFAHGQDRALSVEFTSLPVNLVVILAITAVVLVTGAVIESVRRRSGARRQR